LRNGEGAELGFRYWGSSFESQIGGGRMSAVGEPNRGLNSAEEKGNWGKNRHKKNWVTVKAPSLWVQIVARGESGTPTTRSWGGLGRSGLEGVVRGAMKTETLPDASSLGGGKGQSTKSRKTFTGRGGSNSAVSNRGGRLLHFQGSPSARTQTKEIQKRRRKYGDASRS